MPATTRTKKQTGTTRKTKKATASASRKTTVKKSTRASARKTGAIKSAARSTATASARRGSTAGSSRSKKRTPNAAFMAPMQPDEALSAVIGAKPLPRTQVTKKIWNYIKRNDLQDANKRTMINADAKLKPVFGGKRKIDMFQMTKMISKHLIKID